MLARTKVSSNFLSRCVYAEEKFDTIYSRLRRIEFESFERDLSVSIEMCMDDVSRILPSSIDVIVIGSETDRCYIKISRLAGGRVFIRGNNTRLRICV